MSEETTDQTSISPANVAGGYEAALPILRNWSDEDLRALYTAALAVHGDRRRAEAEQEWHRDTWRHAMSLARRR